MIEVREKLLSASDCFYIGEYDQGVGVLMQTVGVLGSINGVAEWVNPLFYALDRRDFLYSADVIRGKIVPLIA